MLNSKKLFLNTQPSTHGEIIIMPMSSIYRKVKRWVFKNNKVDYFIFKTLKVLNTEDLKLSETYTTKQNYTKINNRDHLKLQKFYRDFTYPYEEYKD